jgi:hypothetical protein
LVLHMIEDGFIRADLTLARPIEAFQQVSRDLTFRQPLQLENGRQMTAVEIQEVYLTLAEQYLDQIGGSDEQWEVLERWADTLEILQSDNLQPLTTRLDWAIKKNVLDRYLATQGATWEEVDRWQPVIDLAVRAGSDGSGEKGLVRSLARHFDVDPVDYDRQREIYFSLRRLDLEYHDIRATGAETGLFYQMQARGLVERIVTEADIDRLIFTPPIDTRAWLRGKTVERFAAHIVGADWGYIKIQPPGAVADLTYRLEFPNPLVGTESDLSDVWDQLQTPEKMFAYFRNPTQDG